MIQKLKMMLLVPGTLTMLLVSAMAMSATVFAGANIQDGLCGGANLSTTPDANGCTGGVEGTAGLQTALNNVVNIISVIVGIIAVLMIIFGGFRYITSGGDPAKVTSAKNTILYGLIGLIIVALAQIIVKFIINQVDDATP